MSAQSLQSALGKCGRKRNRDAPNAQDAQQREHPVGNVLHEDADAVSSPDAPCFKTCCNTVREPDHIRVGVLFESICVIEDERRTLWALLRPVTDSVKYPTARYGCISRRT